MVKDLDIDRWAIEVTVRRALEYFRSFDCTERMRTGDPGYMSEMSSELERVVEALKIVLDFAQGRDLFGVPNGGAKLILTSAEIDAARYTAFSGHADDDGRLRLSWSPDHERQRMVGLRPEDNVALARGASLVVGSTDCCFEPPGSEDRSICDVASADVARWLGYESVEQYREACLNDQAEVLRRLGSGLCPMDDWGE